MHHREAGEERGEHGDHEQRILCGRREPPPVAIATRCGGAEHAGRQRASQEEDGRAAGEQAEHSAGRPIKDALQAQRWRGQHGGKPQRSQRNNCRRRLARSKGVQHKVGIAES